MDFDERYLWCPSHPFRGAITIESSTRGCPLFTRLTPGYFPARLRRDSYVDLDADFPRSTLTGSVWLQSSAHDFSHGSCELLSAAMASSRFRTLTPSTR